MSLSTKKQQAIGLHIVMFDEMPLEKWKQFFTSQEMVDFAKSNDHNYFARVPTLAHEIRDALGTINIGEATQELPPSHVEVQPTVNVQNTVAAPQVQSQPIIRPDVIITELGNFSSLEVLTANLKTMYPLESNMEKVITEVLIGMAISPTVNYLGEPAYTDLIKSAISKLDNNKVAQLGGVVVQSAPTVEEPAIVIDIPKEELSEEELESMLPNYSLTEYPYEVVYADGSKSIQKYKTYRDALDIQKQMNLDRPKGDKCKAKKRKGENDE